MLFATALHYNIIVMLIVNVPIIYIITYINIFAICAVRYTRVRLLNYTDRVYNYKSIINFYNIIILYIHWHTYCVGGYGPRG